MNEHSPTAIRHLFRFSQFAQGKQHMPAPLANAAKVAAMLTALDRGMTIDEASKLGAPVTVSTAYRWQKRAKNGDTKVIAALAANGYRPPSKSRARAWEGALPPPAQASHFAFHEWGDDRYALARFGVPADVAARNSVLAAALSLHDDPHFEQPTLAETAVTVADSSVEIVELLVYGAILGLLAELGDAKAALVDAYKIALLSLEGASSIVAHVIATHGDEPAYTAVEKE